MADMLYLMLAYAFFWILSFVFLYSLYTRQQKLDRELAMLKQLVENSTDNA